MKLLLALAFLLLSACASQQGQLLAYASSAGTGDVRTDGDVLVVVGDLRASMGVRTQGGLPIFLVPPMPLEKREWFASSRKLGESRRGQVGEPLPYWAAALFLPLDLEALSALGFDLTFEAPPATEPAAPPPAEEKPPQP